MATTRLGPLWAAAASLMLGACGGGADTVTDPAAGSPAPVAAAAAPAPSPGATPAAPSPAAAPAPARVPAPAPATVARAAFWADGAKLRDPCGDEVMLRGVNKMAVFADRRGDSFPEIAKTGANTVRIMWLGMVPASEAVQTLQRAVDSQLLPIWNLQDATGDWSRMPQVEAFWSAPGTIQVLRQFESRVIVNIANEPGTDVPDAEIVTVHGRIIRNLRNAGLRMPLMVTASGYGRNVEQMLRIAPQLQALDPLRNLLFDWHVYDSGAAMPARIDSAFSQANRSGIPLVVGEFGSTDAGACGAAVPWRSVLSSARTQGIGWMAWSWDNINADCGNGGDSPFNMVGDGINLSTLKTGWARSVVIDDAGSIQNTSRRTNWISNGTCSAR